MKIVLNKEKIYNYFFAFCVIIPFFNNYEISFLCWVVAAILTIKKSYSVEFLKYVSIFVSILLFAIIVGFFYEHNLYFVIRDITYLLKPILGLILGYQFYKKEIHSPFQFLLKAGILMAIIHLMLVGYGIFYHGARAVSAIRQYGGYFNDYEIYTLIILIFHKRLGLNIESKKYLTFMAILGLSSFFYLARTNFIQFIILFFAMKEWLKLTPKSLSVLSALFIFSSLTYTAIYQYNPKRNGNSFDEFLYKVKMIPLEAFATKINRDDWRDFHDHYRSYENVRTVEQLSYNNSYLFGEGVGSQVNLKQKVYLGDMFLQRISILHNGYMTVLLKSGIVGLVLLLISIFYFFKKFSVINTADKNINLFFVGTGLFLFISYWVFLGFYNLLDSKTILIGFLFAYKNQIQKQE